MSRKEDDALRVAALNVLQSSGYAALRRLRCEVTGAVVCVHGVLPTYYLKQMAQAILRPLDGLQGVTNFVEVRGADRGQPVDNGDVALSDQAPEIGASRTLILQTS